MKRENKAFKLFIRIGDSNIFGYLVILVVSIFIFSKTETKGIVNIGDAHFYPYPLDSFLDHLYFWLDKINMGNPLPLIRNMSRLPLLGFSTILQFMGIPLWLINRLWFVLPVSLSGWAVYYLLIFFASGKRRISLFAALFFIFSFFTIIVLQCGAISDIIAYSFAILWLGFFIRGLDNPEHRLKYLVLSGVASTFMVGNISIATPFIIPTVIYLIFFLRTKNRQIFGRAFNYMALTLIVMLMFNFWWFLPFLNQVRHGNFVQEVFRDTGIGTLEFTKRVTKILNVFQLKGGALPDEMFPYLAYFKSGLSYLFGTFIVILAFLSIILRKRVATLFFSLTGAISIFFASGIASPLANVWLFFWNHIPFFHMFRNPYKFTVLIALSYAALLAFTVSDVFEWLQTKLKHNKIKISLLLLWAVIVGLLIYANSYPIFSGNLNGKLKAVEIPYYYQELRNYLQQKDKIQSRLFLLPQEPWYSKYYWAPYYDMENISINVLPSPLILSTQGGLSVVNISKIVYDSINQNKDIDIGVLLGLASTKRILVQNDLEEKYSWKLTSYLHSYPYIKLEKTFGKLDLYKISDEYFLPHIYPTVAPILINGSIDEMFKVVTSDNFSVGNNALFLSNETSKSQWQFLEKYKTHGNYTPTITFQRINPTKYEVMVENATSPFFLVFSESYHPEWKAYVGSEPFEFNEIIAEYNNVEVREARQELRFTLGDISYFLKKSIGGERHFLVNGYANAWYIDPKEIGEENFTITLYFRPQSYFYLGLFISGLTLIGCIGYLFWSWWKVKEQKAQIFNR
jgi:hypothetical protein